MSPLTLALTLGLLAPHPIDGLTGVLGTYEHLIIIPRVDVLTRPIVSARRRLGEHPVLRGGFEALRGGARDHLGLDPFDFEALEAAGIDLSGPLLIGVEGASFAGALSIRTASDAADFLGLTGLVPQAITVAGQPALKTRKGLGHHRDGQLLWATDVEALEALMTPAPPSARVDLCPRRPGEADLYALWRPRPGQILPARGACLTARLDPGRIRVDVQVELREALPAMSPRALSLAPILGQPLIAYLGVSLDAAAAAELAPPNIRPLLVAFDGRLAFGARPAGALTVAAGAPKLSPEAIEGLLSRAPAGLTLSTRGGRHRLEVAEPPEALPEQHRAAEIWHEGGVLRLETISGEARAAGDFRQGSDLSPDLFEGAALAAYARMTGRPDDGRALYDAVALLAADFGIRPRELRSLTSALGFLHAHLGELGLAARVEGARLRLSLEVIAL